LALVISVRAVVSGCPNADPPASTTPPPGGSSNLTATASSPADGDGTFTSAGSLTVNANGTGFDEFVVSETHGATGHEIFITWDTGTHAVNSVMHAWGPAAGGPTSGFTQCAPGSNPCDPAKVTVDFPGTSVTITSLTLPDAFGGSSVSTLNGTGRW
jgi:hypothetical protein